MVRSNESGHKSLRLVIIVLSFMVLLSNHCLAAEKSNQREGKDNNAISLGFFPIISTGALYKRFSPLAQYLSTELNRPVQLKTAKNFPTFFKRTSQRVYDIVVTAPHFAVKASDSTLYKIRATLTSDVEQLVITSKVSSLTSMNQLSGQVVATPPNKALMTKMGKDLFNRIGLKGDNKPTYQAFNSHNAANEAVIAGTAAAAIASSNIVKKEIKQGKPIKIIGRGLKFPNMATMIASDIDKDLSNAIVSSLVNMKNTEAGRAILKKIGFPGYRTIEASEYEIVRPYLKNKK